MTYDIKFIPVHWQKLANTLQAYIDEKRILVDAFWEDHVLAARHYIMVRGEETIGYFAIFEEQTLVLFNVFTPYKALSQELFARVKKMEKVTNALLPTGDEFFLSHCIDGFTRLEKQAYFACYSSRGRSKRFEYMKKRRNLGKEIFWEHDGIYGARKIKAILEKKNIRVSVRTVSNEAMT